AAAEAYNAQTGALRAEGVYTAAERNPSLMPAELTTGLAASLPAGVVAPPAGAGIARNVAASVLDPTQGLINVAPGALRAAGRVAEQVGGAAPPSAVAREALEAAPNPAAAERLA